jgi:hypothetical protein
MKQTDSALKLLGEAAQKLSQAFSAARESGCDVAAQIIARAAVINASAIEELINPADVGGRQRVSTDAESMWAPEVRS